MKMTVRHGAPAHSRKSAGPVFALAMAALVSFGCQRHSGADGFTPYSPSPEISAEMIEEDLELQYDLHEIFDTQAACTKATPQQIAEVNAGNAKADAFKQRCLTETGNSPWCEQLMRPNPESRNQFNCTYGPQQPHQLIHPDESTWAHAIGAVKIIQDLQAKGFKIEVVYNWWRPEPYNQNVGGAAGRHPFGTSVDVRFMSKDDQLKAHAELCKMRSNGRLRALGYYNSTALHFGVGDHTPNTWGKNCP